MKLRHELLSFAVVGSLGFLVDVGVLYALAPWFGWYGARLLSFLAAATATWALNRRYTFAGRTGGRSVLREYLGYLLTMLGGAAMNYGAYVLTLRCYHGPGAAVLGVALGSGAGMGVNYLSARYLVFKATKPSGRGARHAPTLGRQSAPTAGGGVGRSTLAPGRVRVAPMPLSQHALMKTLQTLAVPLRPLLPLWRAARLWKDADGLRMSAAMSFYGILSLAPLLVLLVAVLGWWLDKNFVETRLVGEIQAVVGPRAAATLRDALTSAQKPKEGIIASLLAFGLLLSGATGVFAELQSAIERLWRHGGAPAPEVPWWHAASLRLRGLGYILAFGFLLMVSLAVTTALNLITGWASTWLPMQALLKVLNEVLSFVFVTGLFAALMRLSSGPKPSLRYLFMGGAVGAILFTLGKHVLAYYLSTAAVVSAYGAAGSLVVLLMWIYFSSAILLYSAGCARAVSDAAQAAPGVREVA